MPRGSTGCDFPVSFLHKKKPHGSSNNHTAWPCPPTLCSPNPAFSPRRKHWLCPISLSVLIWCSHSLDAQEPGGRELNPVIPPCSPCNLCLRFSTISRAANAEPSQLLCQLVSDSRGAQGIIVLSLIVKPVICASPEAKHPSGRRMLEDFRVYLVY